MPELPEVETIVRDLRPGLTGRRLEKVSLLHHDVLRDVTPRGLVRGLTGATVHGVERRAKHAVFDLGERRFVVQPGMTGVLVLHERPLKPGEDRHVVLRARLDDGRELIYRDIRRFGTLLLLDPAAWAAYDAALGPEPLDDAWTAEAMAARFRRSRQAVKKVLMDQKYVVGVGNIYANEALFFAGIDPARPANAVSDAEYARLHAEVRRVLAESIANKGTTFRDYRTGTGEKGNFQFELLVYGREGEPCRRCGTRLTLTHLIDGRSTVFCHRCQH
jgi:formamidopyrimidine-DNA glycosylase